MNLILFFIFISHGVMGYTISTIPTCQTWTRTQDVIVVDIDEHKVERGQLLTLVANN